MSKYLTLPRWLISGQMDLFNDGISMKKYEIEYYSYGGRTITTTVEAIDEEDAADELRLENLGPEDDVKTILNITEI